MQSDHSPKPAVALVSLGCPKNLVDAEVMLGILEAAGHLIVESVDDADVAIVNTCAFIEPAEEEAIEALLDLADLKREGRLRGIICSGCLAQRHGEKLLDQLPEVDVFINPGAVERIVEAVGLAAMGQRRVISEPLTWIYCSDSPRWRSGAQWTTYLKVADGCDNRCTYCTVPSLRGAYRSRTPDDISLEFARLVADGVGEVCLIAQDSTAYGQDLPGAPHMADLLRRLGEVSFEGWIRLLYMHPDRVSDDLLAAMASSRTVVPYFDIPLQHAAPTVLRRMGRRGSGETYLELVRRIRTAIPQAALRTTCIVGFPGETEQDFEQLLDFAREARFDRLSVFRYWPEEGTPAAKLPDQVPIEVGDERLDALMEAQEEVSLEISRSFVGRSLRVLVERQEPGWNLSVGRSYRDAPEVDAEVKVAGLHEPGHFVNVIVTAAEVHDLAAEVAPR